MENIVLVPIALKDLEKLLRDCVKSELQNFKPEAPPDDEFFGSKEASKILGISLVTLHFWRKQGRVRFYKIATRIRFKKSELLEDLQNNKRYQH